MKIERDGSTLKVSLQSDMAWSFEFTHRRSDEASAEAIRLHLQRYADAQDQRYEDRVLAALQREGQLEDVIRRLKRRVQYHRRQAQAARRRP